MPTITKEIDSNGNVYSVEDRGNGTVIRVKVDPVLAYTTPDSTIDLGQSLEITLQLMDFDGELRLDNRDVTFIINGTEIADTLTNGSVSLSIDCQVRGRLTVGVAPIEIAMVPFSVEVV